MNRDKQRRKIIEQGVCGGLSDAEIAERVRKELEERYNPHSIFKLRRQFDLLSDDEKKIFHRDRRRLLGSAAGAGIALIGGLAYILLDTGGKRSSYDPSQPWVFTQRSNDEITYSRQHWTEIEKAFVPVGPEIVLSEKNPRFKEKSLPDSLILEEITKAGMPRSDKYDILIKEQQFMVPDDPFITQSVVRYCDEAADYLYSHPELSRLKREAVTWVPVQLGDDYKSNFGRKIFIGHSYFLVQKVYASIPGKEGEIMLVGRSHHKAGAFLGTDRDISGSMDLWYILISAAYPSVVLNAPFSELIPVAMTVPSVRYEQQHGAERTILLDEALSEAMSHVLAKELCEKLKIPRGAELVEEGWQKVKDIVRYRLMPNALKLVREIGIGKAFDLYMEDPNKFEKALDEVK
ncbi:hypothetical protein HY497_00985 [Candidatus Woesearchaeota archaeon]|nr:hypothetical protein [Candidatus Woesearchaeota archaeon]